MNIKETQTDDKSRTKRTLGASPQGKETYQDGDCRVARRWTRELQIAARFIGGASNGKPQERNQQTILTNKGRGAATRPYSQMEDIILEVGDDEFIVVTGERIETDNDTSVYPFIYGVTFKLTPESAARIGQDILQVTEVDILADCETMDTEPEPEPAMRSTGQLEFFGDTQPQATLF